MFWPFRLFDRRRYYHQDIFPLLHIPPWTPTDHTPILRLTNSNNTITSRSPYSTQHLLLHTDNPAHRQITTEQQTRVNLLCQLPHQNRFILLREFINNASKGEAGDECSAIWVIVADDSG